MAFLTVLFTEEVCRPDDPWVWRVPWRTSAGGLLLGLQDSYRGETWWFRGSVFKTRVFACVCWEDERWTVRWIRGKRHVYVVTLKIIHSHLLSSQARNSLQYASMCLCVWVCVCVCDLSQIPDCTHYWLGHVVWKSTVTSVFGPLTEIKSNRDWDTVISWKRRCPGQPSTCHIIHTPRWAGTHTPHTHTIWTSNQICETSMVLIWNDNTVPLVCCPCFWDICVNTLRFTLGNIQLAFIHLTVYFHNICTGEVTSRAKSVTEVF